MELWYYQSRQPVHSNNPAHADARASAVLHQLSPRARAGGWGR